MNRKQVIVNSFIVLLFLCMFTVTWFCFDTVYKSYTDGSLKIYYRTKVINGDIPDLYWNSARGTAPAIGGYKIVGLTAYIFDLSENDCSAIIVADELHYGDNVSFDHFDSESVEKARNSLSSNLKYTELLSKETVEYSKLRDSNLTKIESNFRKCLRVLVLIVFAGFILFAMIIDSLV